MGDKPFRVLLDLTDLHTKCFKYVWMNVSPHELKTIADFKESVIHKLSLEKVEIKLYVRNGLLLDDETIMVLREDDTVKIHYQSQHQSIYNHVENCVKESSKSARKRNLSETNSNLSLNAKKCKTSKVSTQDNEIIDLGKITSEKKKKNKQSSSECFENLYNQSKTFEHRKYDTINFHKKDEKQASTEKNVTDFNFLENDSFVSIDNQDNTVEGNENKALKTNMNIRSNTCLKFDSAKDSLPISDLSLKVENGSKKLFDINTGAVTKNEELHNSCPKKKRKRHKKRKQVLETIVLDTTDNTEDRQFQSFTTEVHESVPRKHIRYSSSPSKNEESIQLECEGSNKKVENLTLDNSVMVEDVSIAPVKPCSNNYPKMSTPAQADLCKNPNWCLPPLIQKTDINSHNNETGGSKKGKHRSYVCTKSVNEQTFSFDNTDSNKTASEVCYASLPPLNSRPDIGAHIAYKILELDEHYSPVISGYREGVIKSINLDNEEIEIEYLKHEIKPGRTGKFENLKEDEVPLPEIKTCEFQDNYLLAVCSLDGLQIKEID